jgi:hypothetical protein
MFGWGQFCGAVRRSAASVRDEWVFWRPRRSCWSCTGSLVDVGRGGGAGADVRTDGSRSRLPHMGAERRILATDVRAVAVRSRAPVSRVCFRDAGLAPTAAHGRPGNHPPPKHSTRCPPGPAGASGRGTARLGSRQPLRAPQLSPGRLARQVKVNPVLDRLSSGPAGRRTRAPHPPPAPGRCLMPGAPSRD